MTRKPGSHGPLVIAVDGPAASGKGTLARQIAEQFGLDYLDTGSIYRAVGYNVLKNNVDPSNVKAVVAIASALTDEDLANTHLYDEGVGGMASVISAIPEVRQVLLQFQKDFAASPHGAVLDGRDIGTVICPDADFKFFITADLEARATRRYKQLQNQGIPIIYTDVLNDLKKRDDRDSQRAIAPLKKADDAIPMDTTHMDADQVLTKVLSIIREAAASPKGGLAL